MKQVKIDLEKKQSMGEATNMVYYTCRWRMRSIKLFIVANVLI